VRVLGALRQSKTKDRAVSIDAQRKAIERWAKTNEHTIVKFTEDLSTSGKLSAFKRPELGSYLTDPHHIATWDILVTLKIDRACRSTLNFLELTKWCADHGKSFVSLKEGIDMSTAQGRQAARDAASRAEWERDMASERSLESRAELLEQGRWTGGRVAYGYRAEEREDGFYVVPDSKATARVTRKMAFDAIEGKSNRQIARWLNDEGIPTGLRKTWLVETVRQILWSDNMAGLLSEDAYAALRAALRTRRQHRGQWSSGEHLLLRVAICARCSDETHAVPLYGTKKSDRPDRYRCVKCNTSVRKDWLENELEAELRGRWGNSPYAVPRVIPGDDRAAEIKRLERNLESAKAMEYVDTTALEAKIDELRNAPYEPDRIVYEPTGQTIAEHWDALTSDAERGEFLRLNKVRVLAAAPKVCLVEPAWGAAMVNWRP
jgi:site-specific DNA recombinase